MASEKGSSARRGTQPNPAKTGLRHVPDAVRQKIFAQYLPQKDAAMVASASPEFNRYVKDSTRLREKLIVMPGNIDSIINALNNPEAPIARATELTIQGFRADGPRIAQLLANCPKLESLIIKDAESFNAVTRANPPVLARIKRLNLSYTGVSDISALASCTALQELGLRCCNVNNIDALASCTALQRLDLSKCENLRNVSALARCTALQRLDLSLCKNISDVSALARCTALQRLDLSLCENVSDVSALASCTALQELGLSACKNIRDVSELKSCTALRELTLYLCNIPPEQINRLICSLENLNIVCNPEGEPLPAYSLNEIRRRNAQPTGRVRE